MTDGLIIITTIIPILMLHLRVLRSIDMFAETLNWRRRHLLKYMISYVMIRVVPMS